jgi:hypothetical protein
MPTVPITRSTPEFYRRTKSPAAPWLGLQQSINGIAVAAARIESHALQTSIAQPESLFVAAGLRSTDDS